MADNVTANAGSGGAVFATDDATGVHHPYVKVEFGADNTQTPVSAANPLPVVQTGTHTVTGAGGEFPVTHAALTELAAAINASQVDVNIAASAATLTVASHAVTNAGTFAVQADAFPATVHSADYDTGAGTDTTLTFGLAVPAAGGAAVITGDATNGLDVDVTRVQGTVTVDGSAVTQPVSNAGLTELAAAINASSQLDINIAASAATLTVASHAVTNAGTFAVQATVAAGATTIAKAEDAPSASADVGVPAMAIRKATPANTSDLDGDYEILQMSAGRLWVDPSGVTLTVGSHAVTNAGTFAVQVDGNALTSLQLLDNVILVDGAAFTPAATSVSMAGFEADETATASVTEGAAGAARMTLDRKVITTPQPHTAGGLSIFRSLDLDETEEEVKATAGCVHAVWATNLATTTRFLKFYNATAANVVVGTTTPVITIALPGNTSDDISAHFTGGGYGIGFDTAITVAATTGIADNDTGAPAANDVLVNIFFK